MRPNTTTDKEEAYACLHRLWSSAVDHREDYVKTDWQMLQYYIQHLEKKVEAKK